MTKSQIALMCKAMGDTQRLKIISSLSQGDKCASEILQELEISQSTLSHHMKILCDSGLVRFSKNGKRTCYFLCCKNIHDFVTFISSLECASFGSEECSCAKNGCLTE